MSPIRKFTLRLAIYGTVVGYMLCDLFLFHGPLARRIENGNPFSKDNLADARGRGVVARVFFHEITRSQLDRAIAERLWLTGSDMPTNPEARKLLRYAALNSLIDHELLRVKAKAFANEVLLDPGELDARVDRFKNRFPNDDAWRAAMKSQGIRNDAALRDRIAAQIQQEKYVELKIADLTEVTDADAQQWFDQHHDQLAHPPQIQARHIFLPSLGFSDEQALEALQQALSQLKAGRTFATLAKELSQDPATQATGGKLGWLNKDRLPEDLAHKLFSLPLNTPIIVQSKIGWHLAEVTDRRPSRPRSFDETKTEVLAALKAVKRRDAARKYRQALRQFEGHRITVFHDMMGK